MSFILCGLPGSGKTSVGKILAKQLHYPFYDIDRLIEVRAERSCREIVQCQGDSYFRQLEREVVSALISYPPSVIATGGGTPLFPQNVQHLQSLGTLIYLRAHPADLLSRITHSGIPSYLDAHQPAVSLHQLAIARHPLYLQSCKIIVDTFGLTPEEISKKIRLLI